MDRKKLHPKRKRDWNLQVWYIIVDIPVSTSDSAAKRNLFSSFIYLLSPLRSLCSRLHFLIWDAKPRKWYCSLQTGHFFFLLGDTFGDIVFSIGELATEIVDGEKGEQ